MVYFVATPIGNLKDITYRAVETLAESDVIFCEDTRHSLKLLNAYNIKKPLVACHKFNELSAADRVIAESKAGKKVCVITDAGMPVVSDPGNLLCKRLREEAVEYTVLPGACALVCGLVLSAFDAERFTFVGFLRGKNSEKQSKLKLLKNVQNTLIFYCAPQDVDKDVQTIFSIFGDRAAAAVREISKIHEETSYFRLADGLAGEKRGEYVLIVEGASADENPLNKLSEREHIAHYVQCGMSKMDALKQAAKDRGVAKSELYKFTLGEE